MADAFSDSVASDAELARQISSAAPGAAVEAEACFYRRFAPRVRLYGLRHLRDGHAAADLMQQVMVIAIEQLRAGRLREMEKIGSFIFGICRLTVLDARRGEIRRERLLRQYAADLSPAGLPDLPQLDRGEVSRCLDALSERERTVLVMTFYEDRPAGDVAAALGLTAGNVRVIRHRGLARLRDCLNRDEVRP